MTNHRDLLPYPSRHGVLYIHRNWLRLPEVIRAVTNGYQRDYDRQLRNGRDA